MQRNPFPNTSGLKRGGSPGRPKGRKDRHTLEMNQFFQTFLNSSGYLKTTEDRILQGKAPHLEAYWLNRLNGKPVEKHELSGTGGGPVLFGWQSSSRATA